MQRNVPQFIDIEDKIFGPFTLKQFGFLMGGFGGCVIVWRSMPLSIGVFVMAPIVGLALVLAFGKYNTKPFIDIIRAGVAHFLRGKQYRWQSPSERIIKERYQTAATAAKQAQAAYNQIPKGKNFSAGDIKNLADRLDQK